MTTMHANPLDVVHALSQAIAKAVDISQVYELILDEVVRHLGVEKASVMTYDPKIEALRIAAARGMDDEIMKSSVVRVGEGISGRVFASHKPMLINEIKAEEKGAGHERYHTRSLISAPVTCFPMKVGEAVMGVINVTDRTDGTAFTDEDLQLLTILANQAAAYMHICRLNEEKEAMERLKQQLEIARQIQYKLIPSERPEIEGLDVAARLITAERVGGDYFDYFDAQSNRPTFVIADVSGHSIGAAMIMAAFRAVIRAQRDVEFSPGKLSQKINSILFEDLYQSEQFISMCCAQYLKSRKIVHITTAGHPSPIIWKAAANRCEEVSSEDPLLGIEPVGMFHEKQVVVSKGDVVVLYTDGIIEATDKDGRRFGRERFLECISDAAVGSARQIVDVIVETVQAFIDPVPPRDDITALVFKIV